ncbi:MAG: aminotransferase class IV [Desulfobacterales bacterium]|nr:aminotransferase class IV [Desulfobacterales bacterium]
MKCDAAFDFLFVNGELHPSCEAATFDRIDGNSVYEVIKLIEGVPLFFEDHMARMQRSAALLGADIEKPTRQVRAEINELVEKNGCADINVKLVWYPEKEGSIFLTYFVRQDFPDDGAYRRGAHTILYDGERRNPQIKAVKTSYRERVRAVREAAGAYEALLVDDKGFISEGTRSNLFFLIDHQLCTPPSDAVLLGVTRQHVMALCRVLAIDVQEKMLPKDDLNRIEAAFITGTTIDILPIGSIGRLQLASVGHPVIQTITRAFTEKVSAYISAEKKDFSRNAAVKN